MTFTIERRLDFFIIFRCYCELSDESYVGQTDISFEKPIIFFYYSRWQTPDKIKEAFDRLNAKGRQQGIIFDISQTEGVVNVTVKIRRSFLKDFVTAYLSKIEYSTSLKHADGEDPYECNKVIPFDEQREGVISLIISYFRGDNPDMEIRRFDLAEIETKRIKRGTDYQRFCFEEVFLILQRNGLIEIKDVYTKELSDPDTKQLVTVPVAVIEYKSLVTFGRLKYDRYRNSILLDGEVVISVSPKSKIAIESILVNFLRVLIEAQGGFVSGKVLDHEIMQGLSVKGGSYGAKGAFDRLKKSHPDIAGFIMADKQQKNSRGYRIRSGSAS